MLHDFSQILLVQKKVKHLTIAKDQLVTIVTTFEQAVREKKVDYFHSFIVMIDSAIAKNKDLKGKFVQIKNLAYDIIGG